MAYTKAVEYCTFYSVHTINSVYLNQSIVVVKEEISIKILAGLLFKPAIMFSEYLTVLCATWQKLLVRALKGGSPVAQW